MDPLKLGNLSFYQFSWTGAVRFLYFLIFHAFWTHRKWTKTDISTYFNLGPGPMGLDLLEIVTICGPPETWKFVFFYQFSWKEQSDFFISWYFMHFDPSKMNKNWYFYIFQPGSRAHGSRSTWNFISLLWNNMQRYWSDLNVLWTPRLNSQWLLSKMHLKSLSGRQDGHPPSSWDGAIISRNLSHSHFWTFFGEIMTYSREHDVITMRIPQKLGIPRDFVLISYRNMCSDTLIWSNNTCFVQNFK